ncbi:hypothetical protein, partial [Algoriphagus sediminis]
TVQKDGICISEPTEVTVNPQPETPAAPTVEVIQPTCEVATGEITFAADQGVEYAFENTFANPLVPNNGIITVSGLAAGSSGTVFARTIDTDCVVSTNYSIGDQPPTPVLEVMDAEPECGVSEVDLLDLISGGSTQSPTATFTFFELDGQTITPLQSSIVTESGTYRIRSSIGECFVERDVNVTIANCELLIDKTVEAVDAANDGILNAAGDIIDYEITV